MSNPFLEAMGNQTVNNQIQSLMNIWKLSQAASNPEKYLMDELTKNTNGGPILKLLKENNGNFEKTVYDYIKQQGGDPNTFINTLQQSMGLK